MINTLHQLFTKQAELNKRVNRDTGSLHDHWDPQLAGQWLNDYIAAMSNELEELRNCTYWKHWSMEAKEGKRYLLHDLQNARVEVIDLLFFWISLAQCVGLNAEDVIDLYMRKLKINHDRQDNGYSMSEKTEQDNKSLGSHDQI